MQLLKRFIAEEDGQSLVEYGLVVGLLSLATVAAMKFMSVALKSAFTNAANNLNSVT